jgi:hypothetical protein
LTALTGRRSRRERDGTRKSEKMDVRHALRDESD